MALVQWCCGAFYFLPHQVVIPGPPLTAIVAAALPLTNIVVFPPSPLILGPAGLIFIYDWCYDILSICGIAKNTKYPLAQLQPIDSWFLEKK